jgi:hypothetical protein
MKQNIFNIQSFIYLISKFRVFVSLIMMVLCYKDKHKEANDTECLMSFCMILSLINSLALKNNYLFMKKH